MSKKIAGSFALRLRDLLSTLESASIIGAAETRMRGLTEQLQFACTALPADEALVALELATLGRLTIPGVASEAEWRALDLALLPSGTPFAYLLGGGAGFATEVKSDDTLMQTLAAESALATDPQYALFVPIHVGATVLGGAALFRSEEPFGDSELVMAERLATVLSLTLESHRTERVLLQLFATVLPDLVADDAPTDFADKLEAWVHRLRIAPDYRRRLQLAEAIGRIASYGEHETELAHEVLASFEKYVKQLVAGGDEDADGEDLLTDDLYE